MMKQPKPIEIYLGSLPVVDRITARSRSVPSPLTQWIWGLAQWGKAVQIKAGHALGKRALAVWEAYRIEKLKDHPLVANEYLVKCFEILDHWRRTLDEKDLVSIRQYLAELGQIAEIIDLNLAEGARPEQPYWAALACYQSLLAAQWCDTFPDVGRTAEQEEQAKAGPAFELVETVRYFKRAFAWKDEADTNGICGHGL